MASEPSFMASVSRFGAGDRPGVQVVAADDDGAFRVPFATISLNSIRL